MSKKILWSPEAQHDLRSLITYALQYDESSAERIRDLLFEKIELLASMPDMGRPGRVPGTRELLIDTTPYIIPYRVRESTLEILRVYHSSRKWPDDM